MYLLNMQAIQFVYIIKKKKRVEDIFLHFYFINSKFIIFKFKVMIFYQIINYQIHGRILIIILNSSGFKLSKKLYYFTIKCNKIYNHSFKF